MKFNANIGEITAAIGMLSTIVVPNHLSPALRNIVITASKEGYIEMASSNIETTMLIRVKAVVQQAGEIAISAARLKDILTRLPNSGGEIFFQSSTQGLEFKCGRTQGKLIEADPTGFPTTYYPDQPDLEVDAVGLYEAITHVIIAADKPNSPRPGMELKGIFFNPERDQLRLVAGDGTRLAMEVIPAHGLLPDLPGEGVIIPAASFRALRTILKRDYPGPVSITFPTEDFNKVVVAVDDVVFMTQTISAVFPDVWTRLPRDFAVEARVKTADLMAAASQMIPFVAGNGYSVTLLLPEASDLTHNRRDLLFAGESVDGDGVGTSCPAQVEGPGIELNFNIDYLIHVLRVLGVEEVVLGVNADNLPIMVRPHFTQPDLKAGKKKNIKVAVAMRPAMDFVYVYMPLSKGRVNVNNYKNVDHQDIVADMSSIQEDHPDPTVPYYLQDTP